jgi:hypothetical protein
VKQHKLVGAFAVLVLVIAASGVAVARTSAPALPTRGVTDDTITVGGLGYAAFYSDSAVGAQARFDKANSNNEIPGGRKINFLGFRDDGSDQNKNLDEGRKLVQEDGVFAVVPVSTPFLGAADFFAQNKVRSSGGDLVRFLPEPFGFGFSGCLVPGTRRPLPRGVTYIRKGTSTAARRARPAVIARTMTPALPSR